MEEIQAKVNVFYQLGSYEKMQDEELSDVGSEDVDTIIHRYDYAPPSSREANATSSIAEELKDTDVSMSKMNEPPPDILMTSHYNHRSNSNNHSIQDEGGLQNFGYSESEDWEMILDSPETCSEEAAVDIVIRQQPGHDGSLINLSPEEPQGNDTSTSSFYRNARRMVVHQIQGVDVAKPTCGNCCILQ